MKHTSRLLLLLCGPLACSIEFDGDGTTTSTTSSLTTTSDGQSETGVATTGTPTTTSEPPDSSTTAPPNPTDDPPPEPTTSADGTTAFEFILMPDGGSGPFCDPFAQDCPPDMKCTWWAEGGGKVLNGNKCVPVARDPVGIGMPCLAEDGGTSGVDNCELGALCWGVDGNGEGKCVGLCTGSPREPGCASDLATCMITGDGFGLCLPTCDPLLQSCDADEVCVPGGTSYLCAPDGGDPAGQVHAPCDSFQDCAPGLVCAAPQTASECDPLANGCCEPFCDLDLPNNCEGAGQQCLPVFDPQPAGFENVGICSLP